MNHEPLLFALGKKRCIKESQIDLAEELITKILSLEILS